MELLQELPVVLTFLSEGALLKATYLNAMMLTMQHTVPTWFGEHVRVHWDVHAAASIHPYHHHALPLLCSIPCT